MVEKNNATNIKLTPKREILLNSRLKEFFNNDLINWKEFCKKITSSKFLMGEITNFKVQLDWALKEDNILKILENSYGMGDRSVDQASISLAVIEEVVTDPIWKKARLELKNELGEGVFKSWISKLNFTGISDNIAHFEAPNKFISDWIMLNFSEAIKKEFNSCGFSVQQIFVQ